jgi:hypothetical protein
VLSLCQCFFSFWRWNLPMVPRLGLNSWIQLNPPISISQVAWLSGHTFNKPHLPFISDSQAVSIPKSGWFVPQFHMPSSSQCLTEARVQGVLCLNSTFLAKMEYFPIGSIKNTSINFCEMESQT